MHRFVRFGRGCLRCRHLDGIWLRRRLWSRLRFRRLDLRQMDVDLRTVREPNFRCRTTELAGWSVANFRAVWENCPFPRALAVGASWQRRGILSELVIQVPNLFWCGKHLDARFLAGWERIDDFVDVLGVLHRQRLRAWGVFEVAG